MRTTGQHIREHIAVFLLELANGDTPIVGPTAGFCDSEADARSMAHVFDVARLTSVRRKRYQIKNHHPKVPPMYDIEYPVWPDLPVTERMRRLAPKAAEAHAKHVEGLRSEYREVDVKLREYHALVESAHTFDRLVDAAAEEKVEQRIERGELIRAQPGGDLIL